MYPEHEKLKAVQHLSEAQADFIQWLEAEDKVDFNWFDLGAALAEYHGIDPKALEAEKVAMLAAIRKENGCG